MSPVDPAALGVGGSGATQVRDSPEDTCPAPVPGSWGRCPLGDYR